ncbi:hypothetical protein C8Q80DRAFT_1100578 [Daedaleopsis nitida]|nr:hypothetical protein C8Q80DRAFT_1100578 [Daedaleopsis nitida]
MDAGDKDGVEVIERDLMRTPSPTPSEGRLLSEKTRICDWKQTYQLLRNPRPWLTKRNIWTIAIVTLILTFLIAFLANQGKIVDKLHPVTDFLRDTPGGWLVPIGVMFVLSFPPLFGHELIAVLCGDIWGVWIGFGIVAAGTFFGELGNFYAFKWCCRARGEKMEEKQLKYALYAQVVREGGIKMPTIMRFTIIPSHLLTAVFSTCGMTVWMFCVSAFLSLPKQLAIVYIGVAKEASGDAAHAKATGLKVVVILISLTVTVIGMWFINKKMDEVKHRVVYARRKARCVCLPRARPRYKLLTFVNPTRFPRISSHGRHVGRRRLSQPQTCILRLCRSLPTARRPISESTPTAPRTSWSRSLLRRPTSRAPNETRRSGPGP